MIQNPANLCGISPLSHHGSHCNDLALHVTAPKLPKSYLLIACFITLGVDLVPIKAIHNVITIQEDITTDRCRQVCGFILLQRIVVEFNNWKIMINFIHLNIIKLPVKIFIKLVLNHLLLPWTECLPIPPLGISSSFPYSFLPLMT